MKRGLMAPWAGVALGVVVLGLVACDGPHEGVGIGGVGNSANRIFAGGVGEELAEALAEEPTTPEVTDETLARIYGAILERAENGDPEAALVVLKLADAQRRLAEEEAAED